ncbi:MAG: LPS assembly lipoprotein LptE [Bacteroidales bacterium]|nr:LPS assembly lipoprotein LptE [Bacteroidales bacterium]
MQSVRMRFLSILLLLIPAISFQGCKVSYSFSGASIPASVKTASIQYFQNRAPLVQPGLSQQITDALIDKCKAQTNLEIVNGMGDVNFEGAITDYNTRPLTVSADANAAVNRFTIAVAVKFTNSADPDLSFEQTFTRYEDYDSSLDLSQVEGELSEDIIEMIVEDIFNKAFVNW